MAKLAEPRIMGRLYDFRREIDDVFARMNARGDRHAVPHVPPVELTREGDDYVARLDLPGSEPEEIEISLLGNTIVVRGARTPRHTGEDHAVLHTEIRHGEFEKVLELPEPFRPDEIKASYKHGVLEVRIRPVQKSPSRKIVIQTE